MNVTAEPIDGTYIRRLVLTETDQEGHHPGECVGYLCDECLQADETLQQIWHDADCSHAGEHGRQHYDEMPSGTATGPTPELDPAHPLTIITAAETEGYGGLHEGEVLAFRCECGNADEDAFEIVHDEACELAGRWTDTGESKPRQRPQVAGD